jgi:serine/threonine protein kinase
MSNIWTFGVVLWEILELGHRPYPNLSDTQVLEQVITEKIYVLEPPVNPCYSDKFLEHIYRNFMLPCLNYEAERRPRISRILNDLTTPTPLLMPTILNN